MTTIQHILFPVDFSPSSTAMAGFVQRAAAMLQAQVTLLYVLEPSTSGFELAARPLPHIEEDRRGVACAKLESYLGVDFPAPGVHRLLREGDPAGQIAAVARERGIELIVMPTHAGVFRRTLLGSTTAKVLNDADCLVLTTQHAESISPRGLEHREWVCALGLSADSERVVRVAAQLAKTVGANLTLVHAIAAAGPGGPVQLDLNDRLQSMEKQAALERIRDLQAIADVRANVKVVVGPIKDGLTAAARALQADALFIGRTSPPAAQGRLRDLTYAVVRDAPCPVISV